MCEEKNALYDSWGDALAACIGSSCSIEVTVDTNGENKFKIAEPDYTPPIEIEHKETWEKIIDAFFQHIKFSSDSEYANFIEDDLEDHFERMKKGLKKYFDRVDEDREDCDTYYSY